ncbi:1738_t:CDS:1, partial [Racocetra fulgida]
CQLYKNEEYLYNLVDPNDEKNLLELSSSQAKIQIINNNIDSGGPDKSQFDFTSRHLYKSEEYLFNLLDPNEITPATEKL